MARVTSHHLLLCLATACAPKHAATPQPDPILAFEMEHEADWPAAWGGGPAGTVFVDGEEVHGGSWSARIERDADSQGRFTALTRTLPVEFEGSTVELRGYLKTEDVAGAGRLWLRVDGGGETVLAFDNMRGRELQGTHDWALYSIELPLSDEARHLAFGALLSGVGRVWVDDLDLLVDGKPVDQAPPLEREPSVLDTDQEFDEGSGVVIAAPSEVQADNLARLGRVWGFLKYHHPAVTSGGFHWDYELFRVLPRVLAAPDRASADAVLADWIRALGELEPCDPCAEPPDDPHLAPELGWLSDSEALGSELSTLLQEAHRHRDPAGEQFYVGFAPYVGNPVFENELAYAEQVPPDAGYRLLALFRLWNTIAYWFPYRDQIEGDWDAVLEEFVPRMVAATDHDAYRLEMLALTTRIGDGHANLWGSFDVRPPRGECQLPVKMRFVEGRPVITDYLDDSAEAAGGLEVGDVLLSIDGEPVTALIEAWRPFYAGSNEVAVLSGMARSMTVGACGEGTFEVERTSGPVEIAAARVPTDEFDARRAAFNDRPGDTFQVLDQDVAYLKLSTIETERIPAHLERAASTRGLIVDIRNYPAEFVVFPLGGHLVDAPAEFASFTVPDPANPGAFVWAETIALEPAEPHYLFKVVVLVDEVSMSQAEYTALALRGAGALVVGSTTAGADGNVSAIPLPGGIRTAISGIGVFYPDKTPTQRVGIVPDVEVRPTIEGVREGRDEVLERAVEIMLAEE